MIDQARIGALETMGGKAQAMQGRYDILCGLCSTRPVDRLFV